MSWSLAGIAIPAPTDKKIQLAIDSVDHRDILGGNSRDYIGAEKIILDCAYQHLSKADYDIIATIRRAQIETGANPELLVNEDGFQFNAPVIIDLPGYEFKLNNHYNYRALKIRFIEI